MTTHLATLDLVQIPAIFLTGLLLGIVVKWAFSNRDTHI